MIPGELGDMIIISNKGEGSNVLIGIYKEQSFSTKTKWVERLKFMRKHP